jgi:hypothetical protein
MDVRILHCVMQFRIMVLALEMLPERAQFIIKKILEVKMSGFYLRRKLKISLKMTVF